MPAPTSPCGIVHQEEITLPEFGTFILGWGDYTLRQISANRAAIKVKNGSFIDVLNPSIWELTLNIDSPDESVVTALRTTAESSINSYISTGAGDITLTLAGVTLTGLLIKKLELGQLWYDNDGDAFLENITIVMERPLMNWF